MQVQIPIEESRAPLDSLVQHTTVIPYNSSNSFAHYQIYPSGTRYSASSPLSSNAGPISFDISCNHQYITTHSYLYYKLRFTNTSTTDDYTVKNGIVYSDAALTIPYCHFPKNSACILQESQVDHGGLLKYRDDMIFRRTAQAQAFLEDSFTNTNGSTWFDSPDILFTVPKKANDINGVYYFELAVPMQMVSQFFENMTVFNAAQLNLQTFIITLTLQQGSFQSIFALTNGNIQVDLVDMYLNMLYKDNETLKGDIKTQKDQIVYSFQPTNHQAIGYMSNQGLYNQPINNQHKSVVRISIGLCVNDQGDADSLYKKQYYTVYDTATNTVTDKITNRNCSFTNLQMYRGGGNTNGIFGRPISNLQQIRQVTLGAHNLNCCKYAGGCKKYQHPVKFIEDFNFIEIDLTSFSTLYDQQIYGDGYNNSKGQLLLNFDVQKYDTTQDMPVNMSNNKPLLVDIFTTYDAVVIIDIKKGDILVKELEEAKQ